MESKLFDTLLEPTFILSADKKVVYCNEPAALMCELTVRKVQRAESFDALFNFSEPLTALQNLSTLTDSSPYQEVHFTCESGKKGKVQITVQPFSVAPEAPTWVMFFRDVTLEETLQGKYRAELEAKDGYINELKKAQAELKNYSENLEKMVEARTAEIARMNQLMGALLDSLHQGFFIFDKDGKCLPVSSKACERTVERDPKGQWVWDVLGLAEREVPGFQKWMMTVFAEMLPFEDLAPLGPQKFKHSKGQHIKLDYYPLRSENQGIDGVVVVASDISDLIQAQLEAENERAHAKMILQLIKNKRQVASFLRESENLLTELKKEISSPKFDPDNAFRLLHTLKGGAASFSIKAVAEVCHLSESLLNMWKSTQSTDDEQKLKSEVEKINPLFQEFLEENSELIAGGERSKERWIEIPVSSAKKFSQKLASTPQGQTLQQEFMQNFLMEPIGGYFTHFYEVMQSVAEREMKSLHFHQLENAELKILPEPYENLFASLVHAYRNAIDHGIETAESRQEKGKDPAGRVTTRFSQVLDGQREWLQIEIIDDGGGIPAEKIREKLIARGVDCGHETDEQVIQHIFDSQFSTRDVVTETSGRGVGMDAIMFAAQQLGGTTFVRSKVGEGTVLTVKVPFVRESSGTWVAQPVAA